MINAFLLYDLFEKFRKIMHKTEKETLKWFMFWQLPGQMNLYNTMFIVVNSDTLRKDFVILQLYWWLFTLYSICYFMYNLMYLNNPTFSLIQHIFRKWKMSDCQGNDCIYMVSHQRFNSLLLQWSHIGRFHCIYL